MDMALKVHALGRLPGSIIAQVGVAVFDPRGGGVVHAYSLCPDILLQAVAGFHAEEQETNWWEREVLPYLLGEQAVRPDRVAYAMARSIEIYDVKRVWSERGSLDFLMLQALFLGLRPWGQELEHDGAAMLATEGIRPGDRHAIPPRNNAVSDAIGLALDLQGILQE